MKVVILGANGMIGSTMFNVLRESNDLAVWGSVRSENDHPIFGQTKSAHYVNGIDAFNFDSLLKLFANIRPDVVVNCVGLTKHRPEAEDPLQSLAINSMLPHRLARLCEVNGARLVHISTDCVFLGSRGNYTESDSPDAHDFYGKSKGMGEVLSASNAITLRTSTIGHELQTRYGLLEWFLSQVGQCKGFSRAVFSGLSTHAFAQVVRDIVLPRSDLSGLYHVSAKPINKLELLRLIAKVYKKDIDIVPDESLVIDRSLDGRRFALATGYVAPDWEELISLMYASRLKDYS